MKIIDMLRGLFRRILFGPSIAIYSSGGFPDGRLKGKPVQLGDFSIIVYGGNVTIGENVKIGYGVKIISFSTITGKDIEYVAKPIEIGDNVEIGSNSVILPGVKIGDNVTIGAGSIVTKNIINDSVAVGAPAKVIKKK